MSDTPICDCTEAPRYVRDPHTGNYEPCGTAVPFAVAIELERNLNRTHAELAASNRALFQMQEAAKDLAAQLAVAREEGALAREINRAAGELPEDFVIELFVEKGAGWVSLSKRGAYLLSVDGADQSLAEQVAEAINAARSAERDGN